MAHLLILITLSFLLGCTVALVELRHSKLFDESDFAQAVHISNFCDVGCRLYASVPESSAENAKKIVVHDYINDGDPRKNLYDISQKSWFGQKGFYLVEVDNKQINILNTNKDFATAPMAVWLVRHDAPNFGDAVVYEASHLDAAPSSFDVITVMSAEPFTLKSTTNGSTTMIATLTGFDAIDSINGDVCERVIAQTNPEAYSDVEVGVRSPLITFLFNFVEEFNETTVALEATVGEVDKFDFRGVSFAASPGYIGCKETISNQKTYYSSLYQQNTSFEITDDYRWYDVTIKSVLNTDAEFPVSVKDLSNAKEYVSFGIPDKVNDDLILHQTSNLQIFWTRNESDFEQFFFLRITSTELLTTTTLAPVFPTLITTEADTEPTTAVPTTVWTTPEPGNHTEETDEPTTEGHTDPHSTTVPITTTTTSGTSFESALLSVLTLASAFLL